MEANVVDYECLADFLHSDELDFIESLTGITQKMEGFPFTRKITPNTGWSVEQLQDLALDDIIDKVSFLASEETSLNFTWPCEKHL